MKFLRCMLFTTIFFNGLSHIYYDDFLMMMFTQQIVFKQSSTLISFIYSARPGCPVPSNNCRFEPEDKCTNDNECTSEERCCQQAVCRSAKVCRQMGKSMRNVIWHCIVFFCIKFLISLHKKILEGPASTWQNFRTWHHRRMKRG
jgi:hypothetical protein